MPHSCTTGSPIHDVTAHAAEVPRRRLQLEPLDSSAWKSWAEGIRKKISGKKTIRTVDFAGTLTTITGNHAAKSKRKLSKKYVSMAPCSPEVLPPPAKPKPVPRDQVLEAMDQYQQQDSQGRYDHGRLLTQAVHMQQPPSSREDVRFYPELLKQSRQSSVSTLAPATPVRPMITRARAVTHCGQEHLQRSTLSVERMFTSKLEQPSPTGSNWTGTTLRTWQRKGSADRSEPGSNDEQSKHNLLLRKVKACDLRSLAKQEGGFVNRLRRYEPLPDCLTYSPLDDTLDYNRPFHCALCYRPASSKTASAIKLEETSTSSRSSMDIQEGRTVNIVAQNVRGSIKSVSRQAAIQSCDPQVPPITQKSQAEESMATKSSQSKRKRTLKGNKSTSSSHLNSQQSAQTRLQRAISAPHPFRTDASPPPPLPQPSASTRELIALAKPPLSSSSSSASPTKQPSIRHGSSLRQVRRRAGDTAGDVLVQASSMGLSLRDGLVELLTGTECEVQRQVVRRVGNRRWNYIDSRSSTMETVPQVKDV